MSDSLQPHGLQHARLPWPPLSPGVYSNSCPLNWWCYLTISPSVAPFSFCLHSFPASGFFSQWVGSSHQVAYWNFSFSINPFNEYSGLISFRIDWFWSPCFPKDSQESFLAPQFESTSSLVLNLLYGPTLTPIHDYWKIHSFDSTELGQQSDVFVF